jgi:hypothetical protein
MGSQVQVLAHRLATLTEGFSWSSSYPPGNAGIIP